MKRECWLLVGFFGMAGCAAPTLDLPAVDQPRVKEETRNQRIAIVRDAYRQQLRLNRISHRLGRAAKELCRGREVNQLGAYFSDWDDRASEWLELAIEATHINLHEHGIEVVDVLENSAASRAGLKVGDHIIRIDGAQLPRGKGAMRMFRKNIEQMRTADSPRLTLRIRREAEFLTVPLTAEKACEFPAVLTNSRALNAFTDGEVIYFNRGLARFTENDDELASILAHEMAHITMGHVDARRQNATSGAAVGAIVDLFLMFVVPGYTQAIQMGHPGVFTQMGAEIGASQFSSSFEAEADYIAIYLMARAGYKLATAPNLWRRLAIVRPESTEKQPMASHPTAPERFVLLDRTVREISEKLKRGDPLAPNSPKRDTDVK
jgi:hypothetical protein